MAVSLWTWKINYGSVLWGIAHTYITYIHYFIYPWILELLYAAIYLRAFNHQMRDQRPPHRELRHLRFSNIKGLLVMWGWSSFQISPESLIMFPFRSAQIVQVTWCHHFLKSKTKDPPKFLSTSGIRGDVFMRLNIVLSFIGNQSILNFRVMEMRDTSLWSKNLKNIFLSHDFESF